jgi:hypothetical protein
LVRYLLSDATKFVTGQTFFLRTPEISTPPHSCIIHRAGGYRRTAPPPTRPAEPILSTAKRLTAHCLRTI